VAKHSSHILEMSRKGAEHRYEELKTEIAKLLKSFPHLAGHRRGSAGIADAAKGVLATVTGGRKRSKMSAAARKAVSARMKKYWAAKRAAKPSPKK
jgi:hypothetical protein